MDYRAAPPRKDASTRTSECIVGSCGHGVNFQYAFCVIMAVMKSKSLDPLKKETKLRFASYQKMLDKLQPLVELIEKYGCTLAQALPRTVVLAAGS